MYEDELKDISDCGLMRTIRDRASAQGRVITVEGREVLNFSSNDYLGLSADAQLKQAAAKAVMVYGTGAGASRLLSGGTTLTSDLEAQIAELKGTPAALVFNSGYAANTGALPVLVTGDDAIFSDELNHASLIDGCRLARATTHVYNNRDMDHLAELLSASTARRKLIVTDTVFSMDGSIAPIDKLMELCERHDAIMYIDDAHGIGVLGGHGPSLTGKGALAHFGITPSERVIQMGTLSKAIGSFGAFIAGETDVIGLLVNSARSLIYSTALPPACIAAAGAAIDRIQSDPSLNIHLWEMRKRLVDGLNKLGMDTGQSETPIIPIMLDDIETATKLSARLMDEGIYAPAIRPPTVMQARLRLTVTAAHNSDDIDRLLDVLGR